MSGDYVVLHHVGDGPPHFDLMLTTDADGPLQTWRLPAWPCIDPAVAVPLPPHRRVYLIYEGNVSGDRGRVTRVASGPYRLVDRTPTSVVIAIDEYQMTLPA